MLGGKGPPPTEHLVQISGATEPSSNYQEKQNRQRRSFIRQSAKVQGEGRRRAERPIRRPRSGSAALLMSKHRVGGGEGVEVGVFTDSNECTTCPENTPARGLKGVGWGGVVGGVGLSLNSDLSLCG